MFFCVGLVRRYLEWGRFLAQISLQMSLAHANEAKRPSLETRGRNASTPLARAKNNFWSANHSPPLPRHTNWSSKSKTHFSALFLFSLGCRKQEGCRKKLLYNYMATARFRNKEIYVIFRS